MAATSEQKARFRAKSAAHSTADTARKSANSRLSNARWLAARTDAQIDGDLTRDVDRLMLRSAGDGSGIATLQNESESRRRERDAAKLELPHATAAATSCEGRANQTLRDRNQAGQNLVDAEWSEPGNAAFREALNVLVGAMVKPIAAGLVRSHEFDAVGVRGGGARVLLEYLIAFNWQHYPELLSSSVADLRTMQAMPDGVPGVAEECLRISDALDAILAEPDEVAA